MPFTAHDLRYRPEQSYPLLYAYLHRNAQRHLGALKYDALEVDTVIGHVVEQLVRLGIFGGGDRVPLCALDSLTDAQFYTFLHRSVHNKAVDRLRKRRLPIVPAGERDFFDKDEGEDRFEDAVKPVWSETPFSNPEEITLHLMAQSELRNVLKHCIRVLQSAPNQLKAVLSELQELGADELLDTIAEDLQIVAVAEEANPHLSQHKDHAHKKLRHCLQQQSSNLTVRVALRLTEYTTLDKHTRNYLVSLQTLAQDDLSEQEICIGLQKLTSEGLLEWSGEEIVRLSGSQIRRLARFYRPENE